MHNLPYMSSGRNCIQIPVHIVVDHYISWRKTKDTREWTSSPLCPTFSNIRFKPQRSSTMTLFGYCFFNFKNFFKNTFWGISTFEKCFQRSKETCKQLNTKRLGLRITQIILAMEGCCTEEAWGGRDTALRHDMSYLYQFISHWTFKALETTRHITEVYNNEISITYRQQFRKKKKKCDIVCQESAFSSKLWSTFILTQFTFT